MKLTVIRDCERQLEASISNLLVSQYVLTPVLDPDREYHIQIALTRGSRG